MVATDSFSKTGINPSYARKSHSWKRLGYTFEKVLDRVHARDLVCYWSSIELGIPMAELARKLDLTIAAVSYAVKRGEEIAKETGYHLDG